MGNCLTYALEFWEANPQYLIFYNSLHAINLEAGPDFDYQTLARMFGYLEAKGFGINYFLKAHKEFLTPHHIEILERYFLNTKAD